MKERKVLRLSGKDYEQVCIDNLLDKPSLEPGAKSILRTIYKGYFEKEPAQSLRDGTIILNTDVLPKKFEQPIVNHEIAEHRVKANESEASKIRLEKAVNPIGGSSSPHHTLGVYREYRTSQRAGTLHSLHNWHKENLKTLPAPSSHIKREISLREKIFRLVEEARTKF